MILFLQPNVPLFQDSNIPALFMLRPAPHIRYHIAAILAAHWIQFVAQSRIALNQSETDDADTNIQTSWA